MKRGMSKGALAVVIAVAVVCVLAAAFLLQQGNSAPVRSDSGAAASGSTASVAASSDSSASAPKSSSAASVVTGVITAPSGTKSETTVKTEETEKSEPATDANPAAEPDAPAEPSAPAESEPSAEPEPSVPSETAPAEPVPENVCTLSVDCSTVLANLDKLASGKEDIIPADGAILAPVTVEFASGESAFDVLKRELQARNIHFEFSVSPLYDTAYIEGVGNLYEFDCGELSGWEYSVNGVFQSVGCSKYALQPGDSVAFVYTCDLGADVGDAIE